MRASQLTVRRLGAEKETNLTAGVSGGAGVGIVHGREDLLGLLKDRADKGSVEPHALALGADDTALLEDPREVGVELVGEERVGGAVVRVRRVNDDDVVGLCRSLVDELGSVGEQEGGAGVIEGHGGGLGQEGLGNLDDLLVNLAHGHLLHALVTAHLAKNTTIARTNNKDVLRVGMREHRQLRNHLLVAELVPLCELNGTIKDQAPSMVSRLENLDVLKLRLLPVKRLLHLQACTGYKLDERRLIEGKYAAVADANQKLTESLARPKMVIFLLAVPALHVVRPQSHSALHLESWEMASWN
jgi:hypothetical protein